MRTANAPTRRLVPPPRGIDAGCDIDVLLCGGARSGACSACPHWNVSSRYTATGQRRTRSCNLIPKCVAHTKVRDTPKPKAPVIDRGSVVSARAARRAADRSGGEELPAKGRREPRFVGIARPAAFANEKVVHLVARESPGQIDGMVAFETRAAGHPRATRREDRRTGRGERSGASSIRRRCRRHRCPSERPWRGRRSGPRTRSRTRAMTPSWPTGSPACAAHAALRSATTWAAPRAR